MKKSRFTDSQIVSIPKEADAGAGVKEICRLHREQTTQLSIVPSFYDAECGRGRSDARNLEPGCCMDSSEIVRGSYRTSFENQKEKVKERHGLPVRVSRRREHAIDNQDPGVRRHRPLAGFQDSCRMFVAPVGK